MRPTSAWSWVELTGLWVDKTVSLVAFKFVDFSVIRYQQKEDF